MNIPEKNESINLIWVILSFLAYFLGIVIRKITLPGKNSLPLPQQLLLGIPVAPIVVSPFLALLIQAIDTFNWGVFLLTVGIIMEHGMLVNETATQHLNKLKKELQGDDADALIDQSTQSKSSLSKARQKSFERD